MAKGCCGTTSYHSADGMKICVRACGKTRNSEKVCACIQSFIPLQEEKAGTEEITYPRREPCRRLPLEPVAAVQVTACAMFTNGRKCYLIIWCSSGTDVRVWLCMQRHLHRIKTASTSKRCGKLRMQVFSCSLPKLHAVCRSNLAIWRFEMKPYVPPQSCSLGFDQRHKWRLTPWRVTLATSNWTYLCILGRKTFQSRTQTLPEWPIIWSGQGSSTSWATLMIALTMWVLGLSAWLYTSRYNKCRQLLILCRWNAVAWADIQQWQHRFACVSRFMNWSRACVCSA